MKPIFDTEFDNLVFKIRKKIKLKIVFRMKTTFVIYSDASIKMK